MQGKVELAEALGAMGAVTRVEGGKLEGESYWKSGGGRTRLYSWPRVGLADEARPDAAGGEGGHGAAKPHGVIHRCRVYPFPPTSSASGLLERGSRAQLREYCRGRCSRGKTCGILGKLVMLI
jgi:hypothetical protein